MDEPWYKDGLQFSCTGCGNCCTGPAGYVWVSESEIAQIAEFRKQSIGEIKIFHTRLVGAELSLTEFANGDCTFFDPASRRCTIYEARPSQCRTWPFCAGTYGAKKLGIECGSPVREPAKDRWFRSKSLKPKPLNWTFRDSG